MKETETNIEQNKYILDLVNTWISNADNKISISCGLFSIVFAIISFGTEYFLSKLNVLNDPNCCIMLLVYINIVFVGLTFISSLWFYFLALNPSLLSVKSKGISTCYPLFYGDISSMSIEEYKKLNELSTVKDFNEELMNEIYINSTICTKKMKNFKIGMWLSVTTILLLCIGIAFYLLALLI